MADDGFNGSTISFNSVDQVPLRSVTYDESAAAVEISGSADAQKLFVSGQPDKTITFEIVGTTTLTTADTAAAVSITWNDGTSDSFTTGVITNISTSGSEDGEILTSITCKPAS